MPARKLPAAVALGRRGGKAKSEAKTRAVRRNGALRPLAGAEERRAMVAGHPLPFAVLGYTPGGTHVATWHIASADDAMTFTSHASSALTYRVAERAHQKGTFIADPLGLTA